MECFYKAEGSNYTLGNRYIERTWVYSGQSLYTLSLTDRINNRKWINVKSDQTMDFCYEGLTNSYRDKSLTYGFELINIDVNEISDSFYSTEGLEIVFNLADKMHGVNIRMYAIVYNDAPAIRTYLEVKSSNFPMGEFFDRTRFNVLDTYAVSTSEGTLKSYEFFTRTDHTNELVNENIKPSGFDKSNLMFYHAPDDTGLFFLKESPCFNDQRPECDGNFYIDSGMIKTVGWGIRPEEFSDTQFLKSYGSVVGIFKGEDYNGIIALKKYQICRNALNPGNDCMIMANPWGDRACYEHMGEEFVIRELKAASALGATLYQLDDGWQKGEGLIQLCNNEDVGNDYWEINQNRFPNTFHKIAKVAREHNIELALWFAPDLNKLFRNYHEQAEILYSMYKNYGIKKFKIDGVKLRNKEAEDNLERMLDDLRRKTNGDISFNLDTTADPRAGYFMFHEYGNIFLENRYTDWGNYYPWLTLKNLWDISAFMPSQRLQIEFLNIERNKDKYDVDDMLAPHFYSPEYVFAITMFASPLCWFEPSSLDEKLAGRYSEIIKLYKKYQKEIYNGFILPIGDRPSGYSWTGFISYNPGQNAAYLIVFREYNDNDVHYFNIPFLKDTNINMDCLINGSESCTINKCDGKIKIFIEQKNDFKLYEITLS